MSVFIDEYQPRQIGRGANIPENFGRADPEGLREHGFMDVTPQVHEYLQSTGKDANFTPIYYNPQTKKYAGLYGRGLFYITDEPHVIPDAPRNSNFGMQFLEALNNIKLPLAVLTAGGSFAATGAAEAGTTTVSTAGAQNVIEISPDLLGGGEGVNIFQLEDVGTPFPGGFTTNPSITELENGGEGAGLPGGVSNTASFPSLNTIATGAKTILDLTTANRIAQAQVSRARSTQPVPVSTTPNYRSFLSNPGQTLGSLFSDPLATRSGNITSVPAFVIAGIVIVLAFLFLKR